MCSYEYVLTSNYWPKYDTKATHTWSYAYYSFQLTPRNCRSWALIDFRNRKQVQTERTFALPPSQPTSSSAYFSRSATRWWCWTASGCGRRWRWCRRATPSSSQRAWASRRRQPSPWTTSPPIWCCLTSATCGPTRVSSFMLQQVRRQRRTHSRHAHRKHVNPLIFLYLSQCKRENGYIALHERAFISVTVEFIIT